MDDRGARAEELARVAGVSMGSMGEVLRSVTRASRSMHAELTNGWHSREVAAVHAARSRR